MTNVSKLYANLSHSQLSHSKLEWWGPTAKAAAHTGWQRWGAGRSINASPGCPHGFGSPKQQTSLCPPWISEMHNLQGQSPPTEVAVPFCHHTLRTASSSDHELVILQRHTGSNGCRVTPK